MLLTPALYKSKLTNQYERQKGFYTILYEVKVSTKVKVSKIEKIKVEPKSFFEESERMFLTC